MMTLELTRDEAKAFGDKLEIWGRYLSVKEQAFLLEILKKASSSDNNDVEGHASPPVGTSPIRFSVMQLAGFQDQPGY